MVKIIIDPQACKGCNLCVAECPKHVLSPGKTRTSKGYHMPEANEIECVVCRSCERVCPDFAISVIKEG